MPRRCVSLNIELGSARGNSYSRQEHRHHSAGLARNPKESRAEAQSRREAKKGSCFLCGFASLRESFSCWKNKTLHICNTEEKTRFLNPEFSVLAAEKSFNSGSGRWRRCRRRSCTTGNG